MSILTRTITVAAVLFISSQAYAQWSQPGQVTYVNSYPATINFAVSGIDHECSAGNQFSIDTTTANKQELYAMLMFSMATGRQVAVNYGCDTNTGAAMTTNLDLR